MLLHPECPSTLKLDSQPQLNCGVLVMPAGQIDDSTLPIIGGSLGSIRFIEETTSDKFPALSLNHTFIFLFSKPALSVKVSSSLMKVSALSADFQHESDASRSEHHH